MKMTRKELVARSGTSLRHLLWLIEIGVVDKSRGYNVYDENHLRQVKDQLKWEDERVTRRDIAERCRGNDQPTAQRGSATDS